MLFKCSRNPGGRVPWTVENQWPVIHGWAHFAKPIRVQRAALERGEGALPALREIPHMWGHYPLTAKFLI
jgi:hypothetical protein